MSKDDLSCIVRAGLRVGLVGRRPQVVATSSAMDGAHDKRRGMALAEIHPHARERVGRRAGVNWCGEIKLSDETRQELRAKYKNCLCRACLEKAAVKLDIGGQSERA
jgi:hypothetical protein